MKTKFLLLLVILGLFSCEEAVNITFAEINKEYSDNAIIELNIPNAEGSSEIAKKINTKIDNHIANMLNFGEDDSDTISLAYAVSKFDKEYASFKSDFEESALVWEATFDGEVTYHSPGVITIAINSYLNTGGAHGNTNVTLFNFETASGTLLNLDDLIIDKLAFTDIAKKHFEVATQDKDKVSYGEYFFGEAFQLPANIGYNDDGVLLFYNVYEIASYAAGITEFTIPFEEVDDLLKIY